MRLRWARLCLAHASHAARGVIDKENRIEMVNPLARG